MITIHVDHREVRSGVPEAIEALGAEVIIKELAIGDFHITDDVIVERKTTSDFLHSILNDRGHMFGQLVDMCREYKRSILIIEGDPTDLYTTRAVHPNAVDGMLLGVARFPVSLIWTHSVDHTAKMLYQEAKHDQCAMKRKPGSPHGKRSTMSMAQRRSYIVSSIGEGVGTVVAEALLKKFKTVEAVFTAPVEELIKVKGVGKKIAETIRTIIGGESK